MYVNHLKFSNLFSVLCNSKRLKTLSVCPYVCLCLSFLFPSFVPSLHNYFFFKVIGDKNGGRTALILSQLGSLSVLQEINHAIQVPMKFIHVHRNPFDNIATMMLRALGSRDAVRKEGVKVRKL